MITPQTAGIVSFDRISMVLGLFLMRDCGVSNMATTKVHTFPFFEPDFSLFVYPGSQARYHSTIENSGRHVGSD